MGMLIRVQKAGRFFWNIFLNFVHFFVIEFTRSILINELLLYAFLQLSNFLHEKASNFRRQNAAKEGT